MCTANRHIARFQLAPVCNAEPDGAMADPGLVGVPTVVPATPFVDANEETILSTNSNRMGLGDFTRNDGEAFSQSLGSRLAQGLWRWGARSDRFFAAPECIFFSPTAAVPATGVPCNVALASPYGRPPLLACLAAPSQINVTGLAAEVQNEYTLCCLIVPVAAREPTPLQLLQGVRLLCSPVSGNLAVHDLNDV